MKEAEVTTFSFIMQSVSQQAPGWRMSLLSPQNGMRLKEISSSGFSTSDIYTKPLSHSPLSSEMTKSFIFHVISDQLVMTAWNTVDKISELSKEKSLVMDC